MSVGTAINRARVRVAAKSSKFMPDLCTILSPNNSSDGAGGWTEGLTTVQANVPCKYSALNSFERASGDVVKATATHRIQLPATANTLAINGGNKLLVAARGVVPALTFLVTGRLDDSMSAFQYVAATLET